MTSEKNGDYLEIKPEFSKYHLQSMFYKVDLDGYN